MSFAGKIATAQTLIETHKDKQGFSAKASDVTTALLDLLVEACDHINDLENKVFAPPSLFNGTTATAEKSKIMATTLGVQPSNVRAILPKRPANGGPSNPNQNIMFTVKTPNFESKIETEKKARSANCRTQTILPRYLHKFVSNFRNVYKKKFPSHFLFFRPSYDNDSFNISVKDPSKDSKFVHKERLLFPFPKSLVSENLGQRCKESTLLTKDELEACIPNSFDN